MLYNIEQIKEIIPHRPPFLLVDKILSINDDNTEIIGQKCVSMNEPFFAGHFPKKAVMPGVLIVEALAQTGAVLLLSIPENKGKIGYFAGINNMKFKKQVVPGDVLTLKVKLERHKGPLYFASVTATVDDKIAATGEIMSIIAD